MSHILSLGRALPPSGGIVYHISTVGLRRSTVCTAASLNALSEEAGILAVLGGQGYRGIVTDDVSVLKTHDSLKIPLFSPKLVSSSYTFSLKMPIDLLA